MAPDFESPQLVRRLDWFHDDTLVASYQQKNCKCFLRTENLDPDPTPLRIISVSFPSLPWSISAHCAATDREMVFVDGSYLSVLVAYECVDLSVTALVSRIKCGALMDDACVRPPPHPYLTPFVDPAALKCCRSLEIVYEWRRIAFAKLIV
ncbi:hypothetical protein NECAME_07345 [Necator americanus]|uniref:Uncharacterized protein n=1 Tax=Necator americanus TaxID=51031 RepID=W2TRC5_NECAM|nr:hypothetical protein NECAME_07345 [Necator americanus]ETN83587.1 hypothetical protein NECAME_07345 [Necator americanus]